MPPDRRIHAPFRHFEGRADKAAGATIQPMAVAVGGRRAPVSHAVPWTRAPAPVVRAVFLDLDDHSVARERLLLTAAEQRHADRGTAPVSRRRIVLRAGLRRLLGALLDVPPEVVPLRVGGHGRPEVDLDDVDVSCTRSADLGLVAVAFGARLGIDVEQIAPWRDDVLAENWLSPAEAAGLSSLAPAARSLAAARCWTRKEAVLKGMGTGLTGSLRGVEAGVDAGSLVVAGWRVDDVPVPPGHVASVATMTLPSTTPHPAPPAATERSPRVHAHA